VFVYKKSLFTFSLARYFLVIFKIMHWKWTRWQYTYYIVYWSWSFTHVCVCVWVYVCVCFEVLNSLVFSCYRLTRNHNIFLTNENFCREWKMITKDCYGLENTTACFRIDKQVKIASLVALGLSCEFYKSIMEPYILWNHAHFSKRPLVVCDFIFVMFRK